MSVIYSILKPVLRAAKSKRTSMTKEDFMARAHAAQKKQKYAIPEIRGFHQHIEEVSGCKVIVVSKAGYNHEKAIVYYAGGGYIRYQLPGKRSIVNYIEQTGAEFWIPFYPLYPERDMYDGVKFGYELHKKMLERYAPEKIIWLGYSAGAVLVMGLGRHIAYCNYELPMPGAIVAFSVFNLYTSKESLQRMKALDDKDVVMGGNLKEQFMALYNPGECLPGHIAGCAADDDYSGFPPVLLGFGGDEAMSGDAPDFERAFKRCGTKDYKVHVEPNAFHAYPVFTFTTEGRKGENQVISFMKEKVK
ncbi:MAG: alpha/beta hydrolase [Lachnospira sp.]|nr:alpha/beta hydrolase [Lachnospira sp.]